MRIDPSARSRNSPSRPSGRAQHRLDVLLHRHPRVEGEALEDDGDAGVEAVQRLAVVENLAVRRLDQAGEDAQDGRFAAAGRAEQGDDLVGPDGEVDVLQDAQRRAVGQGKLVRDALHLAQVGRARSIRARFRRCRGHRYGPLTVLSKTASRPGRTAAARRCG